uniref:Uncharacterized protein n=1 Tax=Setaria italica TaxID=4555 RepID=K4ANX9_SETIT
MGKKGKENEKAWPSPPASPCDPFPHLETLLDSDRCAKRPQPLSLPDSYAPPLPPLLSLAASRHSLAFPNSLSVVLIGSRNSSRSPAPQIERPCWTLG